MDHEDHDMETVPTPATPIAATPQIDQTQDNRVGGDGGDTKVPASWDDMLNENNFHDMANNDEETYTAINEIPNNDHDMINQIIGIVQNHVSELLVTTKSD